jgi:hypothetical protein
VLLITSNRQREHHPRAADGGDMVDPATCGDGPLEIVTALSANGLGESGAVDGRHAAHPGAPLPLSSARNSEPLDIATVAPLHAPAAGDAERPDGADGGVAPLQSRGVREPLIDQQADDST